MFRHLHLVSCCFVFATYCLVKTTGELSERWFETVVSTMGETASVLSTISTRHCSIVCLQDKECEAYLFRADEKENCVLIHEGTQSSKSFVSDKQNQVYRIVIIPEVWSPPADWNATDLPVVYRSFNNDKYVELKNGAQIVVGKVNNAISTDSTQRQWVSLGNLSSACFTIPGTCGSAGGALSVWIKLGTADTPYGGIISSFDATEGFQVFVYNSNQINHVVHLPSYQIKVTISIVPTNWFHLVFNYVDVGAESIAIYHDGVEAGRSTKKTSYIRNAGPGIVVIGRYFVQYLEESFASVMVDELLFFNRYLTPQEVEILYNEQK